MKPALSRKLLLLLCSSYLVSSSWAFLSQSSAPWTTPSRLFSSDAVEEQKQEVETAPSNVEKFLTSNYPDFYAMASQNEDVLKVLQGGSSYSVFCPNAKAFEDLGDKKQKQLIDPRNLETAKKMAAYHVVGTEAISVERLFREDWTVPKQDGKPVLTIGGVQTMGGPVGIGRSKRGGILGLGAKEDGGVVVGPGANIVQSFKVGGCYVHEVDAFVSPEVLWRYCDQLRIPGF